MDMKGYPQTDLHVTLPSTVIAQLDEEARRRGLRRVQILREAIAEYLARAETRRLADEMRSYADALGDGSDEFVSETEAHTLERLLRETAW